MNGNGNHLSPLPVELLPVSALPSDGLEEPDARSERNGPNEELPARPLVALVADIRRRTGDFVATIADGLCVDQEWLQGVLAGRDLTVNTARAEAICDALHFSPFELWDRADVIRAFHGHDRQLPDAATYEPLLRQGGPGEPPELVW